MASASAALSAHQLVLGRYLPLRPLGSGGSGSVWLARDEQTGQSIALKIIDREGKAVHRAEREAAVASRLRHPRCQRALAVASDARHVYIAYEYVPGRTLREAMRRHELPEQAAVEVAAQVLDALAHAHARGIVHRDVKPANVLLAEEAEVSVRLLDFGLAQVSGAETLTAAGDVPGTLAYISPERLRGEPGGAACDVWAVGVLMWEALARRHPFWAPSLLDTAGKIAAGASPLAAVRPDLPERLTAAVASALELDPRRRPSAASLAKTIRLATAPARPPAPKPAPQLRRPTLAVRPVVLKLAPALLAALLSAWTASALPFYPASWVPGLALAAALATLFRPRAGLAVALAAPVLPLGNVSLGLALVYSALALGWLGLFARGPYAALGFVLGPVLAPLSALGLLPLLLLPIASALRRAALAAAGVATAAVAAGIRGDDLPLTEGPVPGLELHATDSPLRAADALLAAVAARPALVVATLALAGAAVLLPLARRVGVGAVASLAVGMLAIVLVAAPQIAPAPFVLTTLLVCGVVVLWDCGVLQRWAR